MRHCVFCVLRFILSPNSEEAHAGSPLEVSEDLLKSFNISVVARGTLSETHGFVNHDEQRYKLPKSRGIFRYFLSCSCVLHNPTPPSLFGENISLTRTYEFHCAAF